MGGVFENLGTTLNISEPPRVSFAPPRVLLGLWRVFCNLGSMCKKSGQSQNVKCDLKSRHLENKRASQSPICTFQSPIGSLPRFFQLVW